MKATKIKMQLKSGGTREFSYITVSERIKEFRTNEKYKGFKLISDIIQLDDSKCTIKASIFDENGTFVACGHAQETKESSIINKTSYIENCETSAWGRALANLGIGVDSDIASAEETVMAIAQQNNEDFITKEERFYLFDKFNKDNEKVKEFIGKFGYENTIEITRKDYKKMLKAIEHPPVVEPDVIREEVIE